MKRLTTGATTLPRQRVVWPPNHNRLFAVYWRKKESIWIAFAPAMLKNRYWIAFGIQRLKPTKTQALAVRCEINPPKDGINRRCAGLFLKDSNGNVYLAHTGKVGGGKSGIGKDAFLQAYQGQTETVTWPDKGTGSTVIVFGALNDKSFISKVAEFLVDVDNFKTELNQRELLSKETVAAEKLGAFDPIDAKDARQRIIASIVRRRGQPQFRKMLLAEYKNRCAATGCDCIDALEAAHIYPYRGSETNDVTNGLLLRADLHTLFDLHLIGISADYKLIVADEPQTTVYADLHGKPIRLPKNHASWPNIKALEMHLARMANHDTSIQIAATEDVPHADKGDHQNNDPDEKLLRSGGRNIS